MRIPLVLLVAGSLATPGLAQDRPDFSGNWKLNQDKSDPPGQMGPGGPGGPPGQRPPGSERMGGGMGGGGGVGRPVELFITQMGDKLVIDQKGTERSQLVTYSLDGRESRNPGMRGADVVTTSRWDGATLVTEGQSTFTTPMGEMTVKTREQRSLSEDGRTLTVVITTTTQRGEFVRKLVYDKA
jgi:hypothetical protein